MFWLLACTDVPLPMPEAPRPKLQITHPRTETQVIAPVQPIKIGPAPRPPVIEAQKATDWGAEVAPCPDGCVPLEFRAQASSELAKGDTLYAASSVIDGDAKTAWCAVESEGPQLSLASKKPFDLRRIQFANTTGSGPWIKEVVVVTDRSDRFLLTLPKPKGRWPNAPIQLPVLDLELTGVQFVQFEIRTLSGAGEVCVSEIQLEGVLSD